MGRNKTYDRETIARKAMALFWLHGYHGTSTQALVDSMGVNRFSLYAEFGNKQALYEAALDLYAQDVVGNNFRALEAADAGLAQIETLIHDFSQAACLPGSERGCFICNNATERGPHDLASQSFVTDYVERIAKAFTHGLNNARALGQLRAEANTLQEGYFLATLFMGFFVLLRAQLAPEIVQASARSAIAHLHSLMPAQATP
jgi:TetR/AcrR family transcriptional repressor of nem operon